MCLALSARLCTPMPFGLWNARVHVVHCHCCLSQSTNYRRRTFTWVINKWALGHASVSRRLFYASGLPFDIRSQIGWLSIKASLLPS